MLHLLHPIPDPPRPSMPRQMTPMRLDEPFLAHPCWERRLCVAGIDMWHLQTEHRSIQTKHLVDVGENQLISSIKQIQRRRRDERG